MTWIERARASLRSPAVAATAFALVAAVWLNQSVGGAAWESLRDRVLVDPARDVLEAARYPFVFLYRRSHDEELYYATACAILGRPFPPEYLDRGGVPDAFSRVEPTSDGRLRAPYTEVPLEYPPTVLPFVVAPRLVASTYLGYARVFGAWMAGCLLAGCALTLRALARVERPAHDERVAARWWLGCLILLAHGAIAVQRLDAVVALLLGLAVHAAARRRPGQLGAWVGLAAATKILPGLLLPVFVACDPELRRPGRLAWVVGSAAVACAAGLAPLALSGHMADFFAYHGGRGLHVESTFGILYGAARALAGRPAPATLDYGSFNFHGVVPDALAAATPVVTLAAVAAVTWVVVLSSRGRGPETQTDAARLRRVVCASIAAATALWLTGKVFSPQYLTWIIPLVVAVPGGPEPEESGRQKRIALAFLAALFLGQLFWRGYYDHVYGQRPAGIFTLVVRQAVLVWLFVLAMRCVNETGVLRVRVGGTGPVR